MKFMKRMAFIDHSYHKKTLSSCFFIDVVSPFYNVDMYWDDSWNKGPAPEWDVIRNEEYDVVLFWQISHHYDLYDKLNCKNVIVVPMFDGAINAPNEYFSCKAKYISFCKALHERLTNLRCDSRYFQFYPNPYDLPNSERNFSELAGFFWERKKEISCETIRHLMDDAFSRFHVHSAVDPGETGCCKNIWGKLSPDVYMTKWFENKEDYYGTLDRYNVFFAPRNYEGIGFSFLEAMSMGMCVVAPDNPTMNEYIKNGENGLLYDPASPKQLDFSEAAQLGDNARESVLKGYQRWLRHRDDLIAYISGLYPHSWSWNVNMPAFSLMGAGNTGDSFLDRNPAATLSTVSDGSHKMDASNVLPKVSVITVVRNAELELECTIQSVIAQTYDGFEFIVVDGASTDNTLSVAESYGKHIDTLVSEPDSGVYDAMNKAARLAHGNWIIYMNAGDWFVDTDVLLRIFEELDGDPDIIYGDHIYRINNEESRLHRALPLNYIWEEMRLPREDYSHWMQGFPGHQATFVKTSLLQTNLFDTDYSIAADHNLLLKILGKGASYHQVNLPIAVYTAGGFSAQNHRQCLEEQKRVYLAHGGTPELGFFLDKVIARVVTSQSTITEDGDRQSAIRYLSGWHAPEILQNVQCRWTCGNAEIVVFSDIEQQMKLSTEFLSIHTYDDISIYLNGELIAERPIGNSFTSVYPIDLNLSKGNNTVGFVTGRGSITPVNDFRTLSFCIRNASLTPSPNDVPSVAADEMVFVVTPAFNAVETIDQTILSVVSQASEKVRIRYHVQDGGSSDGTVEKLERWVEKLSAPSSTFNKKHIHFSYATTPDNGMYDAITCGFSSMVIPKSAFIGWINADDILFPGAFASILRIASQTPDVHWVKGLNCVIDEKSAILGCNDEFCPRELIRAGACEASSWRFVQQEGSFFKKWLWDKVGGFEPQHKLAADWNLWRRFARYANLVHFPAPFGAFRKRAGQLSSNIEAYIAEIDEVISFDCRESAVVRIGDRGHNEIPVPVIEFRNEQYSLERRPLEHHIPAAGELVFSRLESKTLDMAEAGTNEEANSHACDPVSICSDSSARSLSSSNITVPIVPELHLTPHNSAVVLTTGWHPKEVDGSTLIHWASNSGVIHLKTAASGKGKLSFFIQSAFAGNKIHITLNGKPLEPVQPGTDRTTVGPLPVKVNAGTNVLEFSSQNVPVILQGDTRMLNFLVGDIELVPPRTGRRFVRLLTQQRTLRKSGLFYVKYYARRVPELAECSISPMEHYLLYGAWENKDPNPMFSSAFYLINNRDVYLSGVNPLLHYIMHGWREDRDPHPEFSTRGYLNAYPDVAKSSMNPLFHYLKYGVLEGRNPTPVTQHKSLFEHLPACTEEKKK